MTRYGSRKFIVALLCLSANQWSLLEQLVSGEQWKVVVVAVLGLYASANVAQKFAERQQDAG